MNGGLAVDVSADAILGAIVTIGLAALVGFWKLATMLSEVRGQVRHNGGSSLKDDARTAAQEAIAAREMAERVASDLAIFRGHQAEDSAQTTRVLGKVQHDITNIRAGQDMLLGQQLTTDRRVTDHRDRNAAAVRALQSAVDDLAVESRARDKALGDALHESLDVAIATTDAQEEGR